MTLAQQIQHVLDLPDGAVCQGNVSPRGRALITVVDPAFEPLDDLQRVRKVDRTPEAGGLDLDRIGFIKTNTPEEEEALTEASEL